MNNFVAEDDILIMPCDPKHYFHQKCGISCLNEKTECPLCRTDYSDKIISHVTNSNQRMVRILEDNGNLQHGLNIERDRRNLGSSGEESKEDETELAVRE